MIDIKAVKEEAAAQIRKEQGDKATAALVGQMRRVELAKQALAAEEVKLQDIEAPDHGRHALSPMSLDDRRILSLPGPVRFAGWESDTRSLQQGGWQLSVEQQFDNMTIRLAMRLDAAKLIMISETQEFDFYRHDSLRRALGDVRANLPIFTVRLVSQHGMQVRILDETSFDFQPFDAKRSMTATPIQDIEDMGIFAPCLTRTKELIVDPDTVESLFAKIKTLQAPELAEIRERNRARDKREEGAMQQQVFHAQILSFAR